MDQSELTVLLDNLISTWENETVEFKEASQSFDFDKIGRYFSALSNEANLRGLEKAWLVFGVNARNRRVTGTNFNLGGARRSDIKHHIAQSTAPSITFRDIHELFHRDGRVLLFEIPAAPWGMPIAWKNQYYGRAGESLTALGIDKLDEIRNQTLITDWSAEIVENAKVGDLDDDAIQTAKKEFAAKYANRIRTEEVENWTVQVFLEKTRLLHNDKLTRAALLLLGRPESAYLLSPHPAQMTWKLAGPEQAYEHFGLPFLLSTSRLYQKIRNFQIRLLPSNQLLPIEIAKYDQKIIMEALHNCIAHQDYRLLARIVVTEKQDRLVFENEGGFFEGHPDDYVLGNKTPLHYRNPCLAQAMAELNMIDTMGYGIYSMHSRQAERYLPMPDYDLSGTNVVRMTVYGDVVDTAYSDQLMQNTTLSLTDILALDKIQKGLSLPDEKIKQLRRKKMIEGRKPNLHVSAAVAAITGQKADYIRNRAVDDIHYSRLIIEYIERFGKASRKEINSVLLGKLSDTLDDNQKYNKISNLITKMRRSGQIINTGSKKAPEWKINRTIAE